MVSLSALAWVANRPRNDKLTAESKAANRPTTAGNTICR